MITSEKIIICIFEKISSVKTAVIFAYLLQMTRLLSKLAFSIVISSFIPYIVFFLFLVL